jgi:DNA end-binding protein Ku
MWKGCVRLAGEEVPVRLYSAVQDRHVRFRLLHATDHAPVEQRMVHPDTGEVVPREAIRRGVELEDGVFVILEDEELASIEPAPSRAIEVLAFVAPERVSAAWYDRPYWLGPDGADDAYAALAEAIAREGRVGIARWTMRKREYVGALTTEGGALRLSTLRHLGEVVSRDALGPAPEVTIDPLEEQLAEQLVSTLEEPGLDLSAFRDEHRERVMELVEAKAEGKTPKLERPKPKPATASLIDSLRESVEAAGRRVA